MRERRRSLADDRLLDGRAGGHLLGQVPARSAASAAARSRSSVSGSIVPATPIGVGGSNARAIVRHVKAPSGQTSSSSRSGRRMASLAPVGDQRPGVARAAAAQEVNGHESNPSCRGEEACTSWVNWRTWRGCTGSTRAPAMGGSGRAARAGSQGSPSARCWCTRTRRRALSQSRKLPRSPGRRRSGRRCRPRARGCTRAGTPARPAATTACCSSGGSSWRSGPG